MKKLFLFAVLLLLNSYLGIAQVKELEILAKDAKGNPELISFIETKVYSDDKSIIAFLKKQFNANSGIEFKMDSPSIQNTNQLESKKYKQYYQGIKVEFGIQNVVSENGVLKTVNGKYVEINTLDIDPKLSEKEALDFAMKSIGAKEYMWESNENEQFLKLEQNNPEATFFPKGELLIAEKDLFGENPVPVLTYKFNIYAMNPISRDYVYIDANNGEVILKDAIIKHIIGVGDTRYSGQRNFETQLSNGKYRLRDYTRGNGVETYNMKMGTNYANAVDFTDNDNNWTSLEYNNANKDNAALDAHWGAEKTYDYFSQKHNRNSFDANGATIRNYVHFANAYDQAFWDGQRMTYGDGGSLFSPLTSVDVVGHEIGHGVCEKTANLIYSYESGAINEALSDIWGAMVEYNADPIKQTYLIGEEIMLWGGGALRSMSNPKLFGHPNTYNGQYWYVGSGDNGGVHSNSGVLNQWFYILAEGKIGTNDLGNSYNVPGIGKEKAAKIVYRAESVYFTPTTNYMQARDLTIQAAKDLYGANSAESAIVCQAWYAVGVGNNNCIVPPEIAGTGVICDPLTNYTYTITNLIPGSVSNWTLSPNLVLVNSSNSEIVVKPLNANFSGIATIKATVSGLTTLKKIHIGKPAYATLSGTYTTAGFETYIEDQNHFCLKTYFFPGFYSGIIAVKDEIATSYSWKLISKWHPQNNSVTTGIGLVPGSDHNYDVYVKPQNGQATYRLTTSNACGSFTQDYTFRADGVCAIAAEAIGESSSFLISPNPSDGLFTVSLTDTTFSNTIEEISILDRNGREIKRKRFNNKDRHRTLDLQDFPPEVYIVRIFDGRKWSIGQIIKQ